MAKKQIEGTITESNWYKIPEYKVMLVKDSNISSDKKTVTTPNDVVSTFENYLTGIDREHFCIALLDRKNNILGINTVSIGSINSSVVHPREVFKPAIIFGASSIILCHNHPSGDPYPSKEDRDVTKRLKEAGEIIGINVLDHVILGDNRYYSFTEQNIM